MRHSNGTPSGGEMILEIRKKHDRTPSGGDILRELKRTNMSLPQAMLATALAKASHTYLLWVEPGAMEIEALQASDGVIQI